MRTSFPVDSTQWPEIWQAAFRILEQTIVDGQLKAWIQPLTVVETEERQGKIRVRLGTPNDFSAEWCRDHFQKELEAAFSQVLGSVCEIDYIVLDTQNSQDSPLTDDPFEDFSPSGLEPSETSFVEHGSGKIESPMDFLEVLQDTQTTEEPKRVRPLQRTSAEPDAQPWGDFPSQQTIDPDYTFDDYIVGASNQFAHASAIAVAERPGRQYNPLFIYSDPGLGKTHLLYAIGNAIRQNNPGARICYLSAETFVNELIESLQKQKMPQFRKKFRSSFDVLLIDDIQFIAGKKQTEEEFFHTFNALYALKRQIVLTSDRPPKDIDKLEERIRTRFEWGLVSDVSPPEIETRIAILKHKAEKDDIFLPDDVATFLATHIKTNVRELEGTLIRLQAQASLTGSEISLEMTRNELRNLVSEEHSFITVDSIQQIVSKHYQIKLNDLKSSTRSKVVSLPRQIAMFLSRKYTGLGYREIGQYFGGKDHTTVLHACSKIEKGIDTNTEITDAVQQIQNLL